MTFNSLSEIFTMIDETRARLLARVGSLSAEQEALRQSDDTWSVAQIVEHLSILEKRLVTLTNVMLMKAGTAGAKAASEDGRIEPVSMDKIIERASREKYQAPETVVPGGDVPVAVSLAAMRESREALHSLRPRLEAFDLSGMQYPHPAFGPLNLYEWLVMIGLHEGRHLQQIEAVLSAPSAN